jgi:hypothetical protein
VNLESVIASRRWTPRAAFPPSEELSPRLYTLGDGYYLMTNPRRGEGDPVRGVGWAASDYWARRAWDNPPFAGDLDSVPPAQWQQPSLEFLGRPQPLTFASVCAYESARSGARVATLVTASYRFKDGAFLALRVSGADGVIYDYPEPEAKPDELPVAVEFRLPEG